MTKYCVGDGITVNRIFSQKEVIRFAEVSMDNNPLHLDEEYARKTIFKRCIVHGMLSGGVISAVIGTKFPGVGTIYMEQDLRFVKPIYTEQQLFISVYVSEVINVEKNILRLSTKIYDENEELLIDGIAVVKAP